MNTLLFPLYPLFGQGAGFVLVIGLLWSCLVIALHIAIFIGISQDAKRLDRGVRPGPKSGSAVVKMIHEARRNELSGLFFFGPNFWGLCGLVFGLLGLAVYWLIHHSTLRRISLGQKEPREPHSVITPKPPAGGQ